MYSNHSLALFTQRVNNWLHSNVPFFYCPFPLYLILNEYQKWLFPLFLQLQLVWCYCCSCCCCRSIPVFSNIKQSTWNHGIKAKNTHRETHRDDKTWVVCLFLFTIHRFQLFYYFNTILFAFAFKSARKGRHHPKTKNNSIIFFSFPHKFYSLNTQNQLQMFRMLW